jgi:hypothetical protein
MNHYPRLGSVYPERGGANFWVIKGFRLNLVDSMSFGGYYALRLQNIHQ